MANFDIAFIGKYFIQDNVNSLNMKKYLCTNDMVTLEQLYAISDRIIN